MASRAIIIKSRRIMPHILLILAHVLCKVHEVAQTRTIGSLIDVDLLQLSRRFLQFRTTLLFSALSEDLPRLQYHYRRPDMNM